MTFGNLYSQDVISGAMRAGLERRQIAVAYGRPVFENSANLTAQAPSWVAQNPVPAACAAVFTAGAATVAVPGIITTPLLLLAGFTPGGIQGCSAAAFFHSYIGNIPPGGLMAMGQSAGAGGWGLSVVNSASQLVGATVPLGSVVAWIEG